MTILVTGGSGFIGRQAVAALLRAGCEVHAVGRKPAGPVGAAWHVCDLLDASARRALLTHIRPSHLLHTAWVTRHDEFWTSADNLDWVGATLGLVRDFAETGGRRVVCTGSCIEYAPRPSLPCVETETPIDPSLLYGIAKNACHRVISSYAVKAELSQAWARVFLLHGPYEGVRRLVPSVARSLLAGEPALCGSGKAVRDFLDVRDAGAAVAALLLSSVEGPVNIASGVPVSISAVAQCLGELAGRPDLIRLGARPDPAGESPYLIGDVRRLREEVGFVPAHDLRGGLADSLDYWRKA